MSHPNAVTDSTLIAGIGQPVLRREDRALLTGQGCYSDDFNQPGQVYAAMLRSPHAHARILAIHSQRALALPGVLAVLTGADVRAEGHKPIPHKPQLGSEPDILLQQRDGGPAWISPHYALPWDKARFVGEPVAMVLAESRQLARDAAELVEIEWEPLPAVTDPRAATAADAPQLWEAHGSNVCLDAEVGDAIAVQAAFDRATHVATLRTWVQRVTGVPMEPRAALGVFDADSGRYTLYAGCGGVVRLKRELAGALDVPEANVRVVAKQIGGNFGTRNACYPEFILVAWAARRIGRPVKWTGERSEALVADYQGRDLAVDAQLALDAEGNFLALRCDNISNVGAHVVSLVPLSKGVSLMSGVYRIPLAHVRARGVMSNTPPTNPYRSAGRPEAMFVIERLVDIAARQFGFDVAELRRRNLVRSSDMPFANALGITYDSGDYPAAMAEILRMADWPGYAARKAASSARGKLRGIGLANYVEITSGNPRERTDIRIRPATAGRAAGVEVVIGTLSSGQGHDTSFAQLVVQWLGVAFDQVELITGDTDIVKEGGGSHSGRSMRMASIIIGHATTAIIERGVKIAARVLEADERDVEFRLQQGCGEFVVKGTDRALGLYAVAAAAEGVGAYATLPLPSDLRGPLAATSDEIVRIGSYPYGAQVLEVEIDPETGATEIQRYAAIDDVGRAINPLILHGQTHGGIAQGIGQAMLEHCVFDDSGQALAGSFMDYAMPRADHFPRFDTALSEVPASSNVHGVRSGGEGGTTPALAVFVNAVVDALADHGVTHLEMPVTPQRIWQALQK